MTHSSTLIGGVTKPPESGYYREVVRARDRVCAAARAWAREIDPATRQAANRLAPSVRTLLAAVDHLNDVTGSRR